MPWVQTQLLLLLARWFIAFYMVAEPVVGDPWNVIPIEGTVVGTITELSWLEQMHGRRDFWASLNRFQEKKKNG